LATLLVAGNIKAHATQDVAVVKVSTSSAGQDSAKAGATSLSTVLPGVVLRQSSKTGILDVPLDNVKTFNQILTGNDVVVFGYPSSIGLQSLPQIDYLRPLLRKGIVAGTNPAKQSIILDCSVYFGNSGGPVLEVDRTGLGAVFKIIGVVTEYVPFAQSAGSETVGITLLGNSGYSVAVPMDFVLELLK
jgi:Trypsin-like peptidase domain